MEIFTYAKAIFLVIFFFGASIFVHELGHFLAALWRGLKVTRFSIGFGPRLWTWKREGIEYCISLLPLGGYVALPQLGHMEMIEGEAEKEIEPKPIGWTSKVIVLVAGAFFNVIFALLVASLLYLMGGRPVQASNETTRIGFVPPSIAIDGETLDNPAFSAGLRRGDIITAIDGEPVYLWEEVDLKVIMGSGNTQENRPVSTFSLIRQGEAIEIDVFPIIGGPERTRLVYMRPATPAIVGRLMKNSPAERAELMEGDEILTIAGSEVISLEQISEYIGQVKETPIEFTILRDGEIITKIIQPVSIQINPQGEFAPMLGIRWMPGTTNPAGEPVDPTEKRRPFDLYHPRKIDSSRLRHRYSPPQRPPGNWKPHLPVRPGRLSLCSLDRDHYKRQFGHPQFIAYSRSGRRPYRLRQSGEAAGQTHAPKHSRQPAKRLPAFTAFPDGVCYHFLTGCASSVTRREEPHLPVSKSHFPIPNNQWTITALQDLPPYAENPGKSKSAT